MTAHSPVTSVGSPSKTAGRTVCLQGPAGPVKTRLLAALVSWFAAQGLKVAVVHLSPELESGDTGKDTWKFRQAGANPVALAAPGLCQITYVILENRDFALKQALAVLAPTSDLILVDGPAPGRTPRVIILEAGSSPHPPDDSEIIALISPGRQATPGSPPVFQPAQIPELGRHILNCLGK